MSADIQAKLRRLPKVDAVLAEGAINDIRGPRWAVVEAVRAEIESLRQQVLAGHGAADAGGHADDKLEVSVAAVEDRVARLLTPSLRRVINATGVVLHTNLGRAPLARAVIHRVGELASGYTNLEYDLEAGRRGSRHGHLVELLTQLTGAEDAAVVNNNAAAVMLCLAALAGGREVVVSRGELVEIGGSFRIPDVMRLSGATLVEVGTTNKTRVADYRAAVGDRTAMLLKVHQSNFAVVGFTEEASCEELAALGQELAVTTVMDLGSGALMTGRAMAAAGLEAEPSVGEVVAAGIDVVTFSGDKLLGGPQAGILCGRAALIARIRAHPLMRALRPDKLTLCALAETLALYRDGLAERELPAVAMLWATPEALRARAEKLATDIAAALPAGSATATVVACDSKVGGGAMPLVSLSSWAVALSPEPGSGLAVADLEARLRSAPVPVIARVAGDRVVLDVRTLAADDDAGVIAAVRRVAR